MIEQHMQETRDSLTLKVSALENQVVGTLQNASDTVSNIVDSVKSVVPDTLAGVKESVSEQMKETFDVSAHTRKHPWAMVGGAAAIGLVAGMVLFRRKSNVIHTPVITRTDVPVVPASAPQAPRVPGWLDHMMDRVLDKVGVEVRKLVEVALATASETLKRKMEETLPKLLGKGPTQQSNGSPDLGVHNGFRNVTTGS